MATTNSTARRPETLADSIDAMELVSNLRKQLGLPRGWLLSDSELAVLYTILGLAEGEPVLRRLLWMRHGCPFGNLRGKDGEMGCIACGVDFKRMAPDDIEKRMITDAYRVALSAVKEDG